MNRSFTLLLIVTLQITLHGQTAVSSGFIINHHSDTIFGEISTKGTVWNGKICSFKGSKESDFFDYTPNDVSSYRILDGGYYISMPLPGAENQKRFMELLVDGRAKLYYLRDNSEDQFFLENKGEFIPLTNEEREYVSDKGSIIRSKSRRYIGQLKYGLSDGMGIYNQIERTDYNTKSLIKLVGDYHNLICKDEICIKYRKNTSASFSLRLTSGVYKSTLRIKETEQYINEVSWFAGVELDILIASLSPRFSLITGLQYSHPNFAGSIQSDYYFDVPYTLELNMRTGLMRIPLNLNYRLLDWKIIPTVSLGITNNFLLNKQFEGEIIYPNGSSALEFESGNYQLGINAGINFSYALKQNFGLGIYGFYEYREQLVDLARLMDGHYITSLYLGINIWFKIQ